MTEKLKTDVAVIEANEVSNVVSSQASAMTSFIERAASDQNVDIDKFERLIALKNAEEAKHAEREYYKDLALLQSECPVIPENGKIMVNGIQRSTYAKFEDIIKAVRPLFKKYGFSFSAKSNFEGQFLYLTGTLAHKVGHTESTTINLPFDSTGSKNNVQAIGSSVSYGKRYVIEMLLNIASGDEDDDGEAATIRTPITHDEALEIAAFIKNNARMKSQILDFAGVAEIHQIPADLLTQVWAGLNAAAEKQRAKDAPKNAK